jgi:histone deacetylase 6
MGDEEYEAVWTKVLMPIAREYQPDLVLVSAGFDAADGDMGECHVTPECFGMLTRSLKTLADGKVVCSLEGGYVRGVLGECVKEVVTALLEPKSTNEQDGVEEEDGTDLLEEIDPSAAKNIRATIAAHQPYWKCFQQG